MIDDARVQTLRDLLAPEMNQSENAEDCIARVRKMLDVAEKASDEDANRIKPAEDIIRVMRIYVFEGPRSDVEQQLSRSQGDGTKDIGQYNGKSKLKIHCATIGSFPEILKTPEPPDRADSADAAVFPTQKDSDR